MYCGNWGGFGGYPYYAGNIVGIVFQLTVLVLIVWAVVTVVKSLTAHKVETPKKEDAK